MSFFFSTLKWGKNIYHESKRWSVEDRLFRSWETSNFFGFNIEDYFKSTVPVVFFLLKNSKMKLYFCKIRLHFYHQVSIIQKYMVNCKG